MSKLSTFLKRERDARGWTLTDLAERSAVPLSTLSRYENSKKRIQPDHDNIVALARAFEMDANKILMSIGYPRDMSRDKADQDKRWEEIRALVEGDPRAERLLRLYEKADDDGRDSGLTLLEVHLNRPARRRQ